MVGAWGAAARLPTAARPRRCGQPSAMNRNALPRKPAQAPTILLWIVSGLAVLLTAGFVPAFPCPGNCRDWVELRVRYLQEPGLRPEQRKTLQEFIAADACPHCNNRGRISTFYALWVDDWGLFRAKRSACASLL